MERERGDEVIAKLFQIVMYIILAALVGGGTCIGIGYWRTGRQRMKHIDDRL